MTTYLPVFLVYLTVAVVVAMSLQLLISKATLYKIASRLPEWDGRYYLGVGLLSVILLSWMPGYWLAIGLGLLTALVRIIPDDV